MEGLNSATLGLDGIFSTLFGSLSIRGVHFRNRIVVPPMVQGRSVESLDCLHWYSRLAAGGSALVILESTPVGRLRESQHAVVLRRIVAAIHDEGALAGIQLFPIDFESDVSTTSITQEGLHRIVDDYRHASKVCREVGFDVIEAHGAHGYFLNQFVSPKHNKRTDQYGGCLAHRSKLACEIVVAMVEGSEKVPLVFYRHSPMGADYSVADSVAFCRLLKAAGLDVLDVSPATLNEVADMASVLRKQCSLPVIAVGRLNSQPLMEELLATGKCDFVAMGRQMIADPAWPRKVNEGRFSEIVSCDYCDLTCSLKRQKVIYCGRSKGEAISRCLRHQQL